MKKLICLCLCLLLLAGCAATYDGPTEAKPMLTEYTVDQYYSFFDGEVIHHTNRIVYAYDIYGNRVREMEYRDNELQIVTNLKYDDRGNCIGWQSYKDGKPYDRYEADYDEQDRQVRGRRYDANGQLTSETEYVYDEELGTKSYSKNDGGRRVETYHADGRLHAVEDYEADGSLTMLQRYYYRDILVPAEEE